MKLLSSLTRSDIDGKRVLVRLDLNVPIADGRVVDDFRIKSALPTLRFIDRNGGEITVIAHCEANHGEDCTLDAATTELVNQFGKPIKVLPNLRENEGEKNNDEVFAQELATMGDMFVNDAFSVSHRAHASIVGIPKFLPSYAGLQFEKEVNELSKAFNPDRPFVFIIGGAKFETKLPLVEKFLDKADIVFVGGALANDIRKANGEDVKQSVVAKVPVHLSHVIGSPKVIKVTDVVWHEDRIVDIGMESINKVIEAIKDAKLVVWNGPMGYTEGGFSEATITLAKAIAASGAYSIIGGGDTLASIAPLHLEQQFSFISTGGGAMLDFLSTGTLPGIEALG